MGIFPWDMGAHWLVTTLYWYVILLIVGVAFFPLARRLFGAHFIDQGYGFTKAIGIVVVAYFMFVGGIVHIVPFAQVSIVVVLLIAGVINWYLLLRWHNTKLKDLCIPWKIILFEEVVGILVFVAYTMIRGDEPSIRSLEKFMDFGFMNAIARSQYFPPLDMWLSADPSKPHGYTINYYYFGHLTGALLTELTGVHSAVGYTLMLSTIVVQGVVGSFSLVVNAVALFAKSIGRYAKTSIVTVVVCGLLGAYMVNFSGNLHPIYVMTNGYESEAPVPFWKIMQTTKEIGDRAAQDDTGVFDAMYKNASYWYPNATRFIPYTIHEFPSYSYVVADLHGHVFDIPFVLLTLAIILHAVGAIYMKDLVEKANHHRKTSHGISKHWHAWVARIRVSSFWRSLSRKRSIQHMGIFIARMTTPLYAGYTTLLGFMIAIHYMTNAFDGPIYMLLTIGLLVMIFGFSGRFLFHIVLVVGAFWFFSKPFSYFFEPFVSGIGVNCSPSFLTDLQKLGPFLFEQGNCQVTEPWMFLILWGFFWMSALLFFFTLGVEHRYFEDLWRYVRRKSPRPYKPEDDHFSPVDIFVLVVFAYGTFLVLVPEFFYIKDIYPQHFRANTLFKMGYQAFIMMSFASAYVLYRILVVYKGIAKFIMLFIFGLWFLFPFLYPMFAFPSYYTGLKKSDSDHVLGAQSNEQSPPPELDGSVWLLDEYPQDREIIEFFNTQVGGQPNILEAQGDSYTDYARISAYTGLPTVAGWTVHQWLWRGDSTVVSERIPDIETLYKSQDTLRTRALVDKYRVEYVVVSELEREKYPDLYEDKWSTIGELVFTSSNGKGKVYKMLE